MDSDDLTPAQFAAMRDSVQRQRGYLRRLIERMEAEHFPPQDPLYKRTVNTFNATHDLWVHLFYRACGDSNGGGFPKTVDGASPMGTDALNASQVQTTHPRRRGWR